MHFWMSGRFWLQILAVMALIAPQAYAETAEEETEEKEVASEEATEKSAEEIAKEIEAEDVTGSGWGFEVSIDSVTKYKKEKYTKPDENKDKKDKDKEKSDSKDSEEDKKDEKDQKKEEKKKTEFTDDYNLQAEHAIDPSYALTGSYGFDIWGKSSVSSYVELGLSGTFRNLEKVIDDNTKAPSLGFTFTPAATYIPSSEVPLDGWGLDDQVFDFGSVYAYVNVSANTKTNFKEKVTYSSYAYFEHAFDPLGKFSVLWGEAEFGGVAINLLGVSQSLSEVSKPASIGMIQVARIGLSKFVDGHYMAADLNNILFQTKMPLNKFDEMLFDYDREDFAFYQYLRLYYQYVPWKFSHDLRVYRIPHPDDPAQHFKTHGFTIRYILGYII